jgi:hypothetical protein
LNDSFWKQKRTSESLELPSEQIEPGGRVGQEEEEEERVQLG